jgi:hypothetical protein
MAQNRRQYQLMHRTIAGYLVAIMGLGSSANAATISWTEAFPCPATYNIYRGVARPGSSPLELRGQVTIAANQSLQYTDNEPTDSGPKYKYAISMVANNQETGFSNIAFIGRDHAVTIDVANSFVVGNQNLSVTWNDTRTGSDPESGAPGVTDYLGIYQVGDPNATYQHWVYLSCNRDTPPAAPILTGSCVLPVASGGVTVPPGKYNARFFKGGTSQHIAVSPAFEVR